MANRIFLHHSNRWAATDMDRLSLMTKFSTVEIGVKKYRSAQNSLSRALTRLYRRGLIEFDCGTGTYGGGIALTLAGFNVAWRQLRNVNNHKSDQAA